MLKLDKFVVISFFYGSCYVDTCLISIGITYVEA